VATGSLGRPGCYLKGKFVQKKKKTAVYKSFDMIYFLVPVEDAFKKEIVLTK